MPPQFEYAEPLYLMPNQKYGLFLPTVLASFSINTPTTGRLATNELNITARVALVEAANTAPDWESSQLTGVVSQRTSNPSVSAALA